MRKLFSLLFMIGYSIISYSQCNTGCIIGNSTITLGQTATFTSPLAQCSSCYDWDINNNSTSSDNQTVGTVKIVGTDMSQSVQIQGVAIGPFSLQLTYFDETGCHTSCFNGNVIAVGVDCSCTPNFSSYYICDKGPEKGFIYDVFDSCNMNDISSININLSCGTFTNGPLIGQAYGTINAPFSSLVQDGLRFANCDCLSSYSITITYNYNNGCSSKTVNKNFLYDIPLEVLGKTSEQNVKLFPNPSTSKLNFEGENLDIYWISIFNSDGIEVIKDLKIVESLSLEKLKKGIYLYSIIDKRGYEQEGKIIKE